MNPLISLVFLITIGLIVIFMVLSSGQSIIDLATNEEKLRQAEDVMKFIDNSISDITEEGIGAKRIIEFSSPGSFETIPQADVLQFYTESSVIDYFPRKIISNMIYISGNDVSCHSGDELTMENSYLKVALQKVNPTSAINTENNIISIEEKTISSVVYPINSSIIIDDDPETAYGTGYSEILKKGGSLPSCQAHFYVNSTVSYDIYYTLYAYADFLVIDVRNVAN